MKSVKSNPTTFLGLLLLVMLLAAGVTLARGGHHRREGRPAGREVRAYVEANALPVLREQRQKLEPQLAAADRAQLATYRTQLKALKVQGKALRHSVAPEGAASTGTRSVLTDAQQQQAHLLRSQAKSIMLNVAQMARRYDAPITKLADEVQPQKEKWATDIKAIAAKNATPEQQAAVAGHLRERDALRRFFKPAMFLLMDPNAPAEGPAERGPGTTRSYPNPTTATSHLDYEVKKTGPVTVDLLDANGRQLRTLLPETTQEKGPHTQQLDLHDLPAGTYFYKITTKRGSETKRLVKE